MVILSPAIEKDAQSFIKTDWGQITYINDQKSILEARMKKLAGTNPTRVFS